MRTQWLEKLAHLHASYPGRMLITVLILTVGFAALSTQLGVTMRWSDLLPSNDPRTIQYNKIVKEFVTASSIIVVVQGDESQIKQFAEDLVPKLEKTSIDKEGNPFPLIQRVDYKSEIDYMKNHGLMLMKEDDLKNMQEVFTDPTLSGFLFNLNNAMEKEYVKRDESLSTREKEDQAVQFLDGVDKLIQMLTRSAHGETLESEDIHQTADQFLFGEPYFLSYDKQALIINAIPNFAVTDVEMAVVATDKIQALIDQFKEKYPGVQAGLTGFIPISHDEMVYSEQSLGTTSIIAVIAILILLIISFRMWLAPLFAIVNLIIGIIWAMGLVAVLVGQLNIMTQMMSVILLGLGIDFSIHLISGFTEHRSLGNSIEESLNFIFTKIGKGVITGGLTTAFAFFTMMISHSRGMKEMGLVTGAGLLAILFSSFLILPIFLVYRGRTRDKKHQKAIPTRDISFEFLGKTGEWLSDHYKLTFATGLVLTALMFWAASNITFDQNYMNIEPKDIASVALEDTILDKFDLSTDYALILTDSPQESYNLAKEYRDMSTVAMTEDISLYLPTSEQQAARKPYLQEIRQTMDKASIPSDVTNQDVTTIIEQIDRLRNNVIEMQDMAYLGGQDKVDNKCKTLVGDPDAANPVDRIEMLYNLLINNPNTWQLRNEFTDIQRVFSPYFQKWVVHMANEAPIQINDLPETVLDRYSNESRSQFMITVFPAGSVWQDADFLKRFVNDMEYVSPKATGMPVVFYALIDIIGRDGRMAMMCTLVIVFLLLWLDFRNVKYALFAMVPLASGLIWMVGLMKLTGQQFTAMNVMGLPMILGIGIDDGVHIVHRWLAEGKGKIHVVFSSTGKAILLTTMTTMLGFGSLTFSIWRGFGQLGAALFVGVGACFLTTILFLSSILGWHDSKGKQK